MLPLCIHVSLIICIVDCKYFEFVLNMFHFGKFCCHRINQYLCKEPSSAELRYAIATRHSMRRRVPVHTRAIVNFDFGAATVGSESSIIHLMLENKGDVPTEW